LTKEAYYVPVSNVRYFDRLFRSGICNPKNRFVKPNIKTELKISFCLGETALQSYVGFYRFFSLCDDATR